MIELPVQRDESGAWTHPAFDEFCGGREYIPKEEFNEGIESLGLEWDCDLLECSDSHEATNEYMLDATFVKWQPTKPSGDGWFIASIHDTEDGPVCIWLRKKVTV